MSKLSRPQLQTKRFTALVLRKCVAFILLWRNPAMENTIHWHGTCSGLDLGGPQRASDF